MKRFPRVQVQPNPPWTSWSHPNSSLELTSHTASPKSCSTHICSCLFFTDTESMIEYVKEVIEFRLKGNYQIVLCTNVNRPNPVGKNELAFRTLLTKNNWHKNRKTTYEMSEKSFKYFHKSNLILCYVSILGRTLFKWIKYQSMKCNTFYLFY
jgi:hypothetical protein